MFNRVPSGGRLAVGDVVKVLEKRFPYVEVSSILGADSSYDTHRKVRHGTTQPPRRTHVIRLAPRCLCCGCGGRASPEK